MTNSRRPSSWSPTIQKPRCTPGVRSISRRACWWRWLAVQSAISLANVLPIAHEVKIRQIPGIVDVCQMQWFGAYYKEPKNFFANFAIDHQHMRTVFDDYQTSD